ncbi:hypothetical protein EA473_02570 [Natrarchaeobius chitinivorans]|uniref:Rubrerythrin-like domain-containing protein n=1 Tax=Natrarchaeobius chitinivorans TaxID=1679083 RepID=A0A3N6PGR2_NATCH|nr:hypothetical protein [Natrarchaeobius chitinivorans]RQG96985.1 hypothetical protein EA473_02570 [Natrarchaeobius chitinivorans]
MSSQRRSSQKSQSTMRRAVKSVLFRTDDSTTVEECRRCGKTIESTQSECPLCECEDIVTYRIR